MAEKKGGAGESEDKTPLIPYGGTIIPPAGVDDEEKKEIAELG